MEGRPWSLEAVEGRTGPLGAVEGRKGPLGAVEGRKGLIPPYCLLFRYILQIMPNDLYGSWGVEHF